MTTKTAAERIAALRDEYARLGEDVTDLCDLDLLNREVERADRAWQCNANTPAGVLEKLPHAGPVGGPQPALSAVAASPMDDRLPRGPTMPRRTPQRPWIARKAQRRLTVR